MAELMEIGMLESELRKANITILDTERAPGGGRWVKGTVGQYAFHAKVFAIPPVQDGWKVPGCSHISKLTVTRLDGGTIVYEWDRGVVTPPDSKLVVALVSLLSDKLNPMVFPSIEQRGRTMERER